jgi:signal transduction histidine kinase
MYRNLLINGGFALALAILALIAWLNYQNVEGMAEYERWELHSYAVNREFTGLLLALEGVETGVRDFVVTGRNKYLESYHAADGQIDQSLAQLRREMKEDDRHEDPLDAIESLIRERLAIAEKSVELRRTAGFQAAYQLVVADKNRDLMNEIRRRAIGAGQEEERLLKELNEEEQSDIKKALQALIAGGTVSFSLLFMVFLLLKREIGQRSKVEVELRKHRDHLEELVQQRTGELIVANNNVAAHAAELEAANRELETFNYSVAHDLRNPLNVISSYCQAIMELCGEKLDVLCRRYIKETYDATLRMNRLIEALLNFSRLSHIEPHRETVDVSALAHEVAAELKLAEPGRRVTFLIADGVNADGDADLLRVMLANLFGNACKFTASREEGIIEFGMTEFDGKPACFVRDNGDGFDMADAGKLFIPFQLLSGGEECRGFGIGLATVERIIKRHGGNVWAEGAPGKGACFYFTLPEER